MVWEGPYGNKELGRHAAPGRPPARSGERTTARSSSRHGTPAQLLRIFNVSEVRPVTVANLMDLPLTTANMRMSSQLWLWKRRSCYWGGAFP